MRRGRLVMLLSCVLTAVVLSSPAAGQFDPNAYDVYKYSQPEADKDPVGDVDKPGVPPGPPTDPCDDSCWQAAAANILGAAGYGQGATAQQRAQGIYNQIINDLGNWRCGYSEWAVNYWMLQYGKNPSSSLAPNPDFDPNINYTDVTIVERSLYAPDYNFLLDELERCQYVTVGFTEPAHCITLVGGDYWDPNNPCCTTQSVWHDSDKDQVLGQDDDVYTNQFFNCADPCNPVPLGWNLIGGPQHADRYVTLCPGLTKPEEAMRNYDVAYFRKVWQQEGDYWNLAPGFRTAGEHAAGGAGTMFQEPEWLDANEVQIFNEVVPEYWKEVWLLIDYKDRDPNHVFEDVKLIDDGGTEWAPTSVTASADGGQVLFYWKVDPQPAFEIIKFPDPKYSTLTGNVKDWNLATLCVPEPGTAALLIGGAVLAIRRRRRRRRE